MTDDLGLDPDHSDWHLLALASRQATSVDAFVAQAVPLLRRALGDPGVRIDLAPGEPTPGGVPAPEVCVVGADQGSGQWLALVTLWLRATIERIQAGADLADLRGRVDNAQQLANMGDYDWHIGTDTNQWSDQLYRIYGHEPQSFNASYDRFLSQLHPDDRDRIQAVHQAAYATGANYQMLERIVRPDGQVRFLASNGQVVTNDAGTPVRMRGTCIDITDRRQHAESIAQVLVDASLEAVVVVDGTGRITQANRRATQLLGADPLGRAIDELFPEGTENGRAVAACGLHGEALTLDLNTALLPVSPDSADQEQAVALFFRDARERLADEALVANLREAHVRRRHALDLNDNVMQGLTAAALALSLSDHDAVASYLSSTLDAARSMMNDLLGPLGGGDVVPGDLVRSNPSRVRLPQTAGHSAPAQPRSVRVVLVDDNEDVRALMRAELEANGFTIVAEGSDGHQAVELAGGFAPDVIVLDLAMPNMDGLQALPLVRSAAPGTKVVVVSGFDQATMSDKALAAGADRYVEKGLRMNLPQAIEEVLAGNPS